VKNLKKKTVGSMGGGFPSMNGKGCSRRGFRESVGRKGNGGGAGALIVHEIFKGKKKGGERRQWFYGRLGTAFKRGGAFRTATNPATLEVGVPDGGLGL